MSRRSALLVPVALAALTAAAAPIVQLAFPILPPDHPDYDRWETGESGTSFFDDQWELRSTTPRGVRRTSQAGGLAADEAWKLTTGRRDVVVAVLDSGIKWGDRDLFNQFYLNRGELPEP